MQVPSNAVIVSLPHCKACLKIAEQYPQAKHIILEAKSESEEMFKAKRAVTKLRVAGYPVVLNESMTSVIGYPAPLPKGV